MNLKKLGIVVVAGVVMLSSAIALAVNLRPDVEIEFGAGQERYKVNGTVKAFNENTENLPYIDEKNQKLMLPLRTVVSELKGSITWEDENKIIEVLYENKNLRMHIDNLHASLNNYPIMLSDMPVISKGSIYVTADFFATYFGTDVQWDESKKQITLKTKRAFQPVVAVNQITKEWKEGKYSIEIPVITGLNDGNFEKSLNATLSEAEIQEADEFLTKAKALYSEDGTAFTWITTCTVPYSRQEMISILIEGESSTAMGTVPIKKAINIDLQGQKRLMLGDLFKDKNYLIKLEKNLNLPTFLISSTLSQQFYFNEKQQLVLFFQKNGNYEEYTIDWDEIEGMLNTKYRFFTTAKMEKIEPFD